MKLSASKVIKTVNKSSLREAPIIEPTYKTVFLLALASAGRRSELHALLIDDKHILLDKEGRKATLFFAPEFLRKNQKVDEIFLTHFCYPCPSYWQGATCSPNCPVISLKLPQED